jgi:hypothetical protein
MPVADERAVRALVRAYADRVEDAEHARAVFARAGELAVVAILADMVRSRDREDAWRAMLFARDVINYRMSAAFEAALPGSRLLASLGELLAAPDWRVRGWAIYTLGKMGPRENAALLERALPRALARDPLLVPDLLFELSWLASVREQERGRAAFWIAAASPLYLARWASLEAASHVHPEPPDDWPRPLGTALADDPHPLVRAEARALLAGTEPTLPFSELALRFSNYLEVRRRRDYRVAEMDAFARYGEAHPFRREGGHAEEAAEFVAWRRGRAGRGDSEAS